MSQRVFLVGHAAEVPSDHLVSSQRRLATCPHGAIQTQRTNRSKSRLPCNPPLSSSKHQVGRFCCGVESGCWCHAVGGAAFAKVLDGVQPQFRRQIQSVQSRWSVVRGVMRGHPNSKSRRRTKGWTFSLVGERQSVSSLSASLVFFTEGEQEPSRFGVALGAPATGWSWRCVA